MLDPQICERALGAHDARFDGLFYVGIITTRIYCRPTCPARVSYTSHRRFFESAASAERAGFRPCLRCRPELAPGKSLMDAVPRLARVAAYRIAAGALNGRGVAHLARDLGVSERHLRRALERELGVSPIELAQTHRLLLAKRLLADTSLPVTRIAFASGFQSLRRFNTVFRERYRMNPSALRRARQSGGASPPDAAPDLVRLTLSYRPPLDWDALIDFLRRESLPGADALWAGRYARTVQIDGRRGVVIVANAPADGGRRPRVPRTQLYVDVSPSLLPALMPLLARLRQLFDLDAEPAVLDACLEEAGLSALVTPRRGVRLPGAMDGFEAALRILLRDSSRPERATMTTARRVVDALGEPLTTPLPGLTRLAPTARRVAEAGSTRLAALGVVRRRADAIVAVAHAMATAALRLEPAGDTDAAHQALVEIGGISDRLATTIVMRAMSWPDALPASDRELQRAAGVSSARELLARAERWRPWRSYAAMRLWLQVRA